MKTLLARVLAIGSLVSLVMSVTAEETQAQTKKVYRGSIKDHVKTESRVEKRVSYERPPWAFEVPRQRVKPIGPPPVDFPDTNTDSRPGIGTGACGNIPDTNTDSRPGIGTGACGNIADTNADSPSGTASSASCCPGVA